MSVVVSKLVSTLSSVICCQLALFAFLISLLHLSVTSHQYRRLLHNHKLLLNSNAACVSCCLQEVLLFLKPHLSAPYALWAPSLLEATGSSAVPVPSTQQVHLVQTALPLVSSTPLHAHQARLHHQKQFQAVNAAAGQALAGPATQQQAAARSALWARLALEKACSPCLPCGFGSTSPEGSDAPTDCYPVDQCPVGMWADPWQHQRPTFLCCRVHLQGGLRRWGTGYVGI